FKKPLRNLKIVSSHSWAVYPGGGTVVVHNWGRAGAAHDTPRDAAFQNRNRHYSCANFGSGCARSSGGSASLSSASICQLCASRSQKTRSLLRVEASALTRHLSACFRNASSISIFGT